MRLLLAAVLCLQVLFSGESSACVLPIPKGPVILTVEGQISHCNEGLVVQFDMDQLEQLPRQTVTTENPWQDGAATYEGVLLRDLAAHVGARGRVLSIAALNDYSADIDIADTQTIDVILAYKRDGQYMPVREKGPLFVIFPFSGQSLPEIDKRYAQSVWQVSRITVK
jgi:hypothetical protein